MTETRVVVLGAGYAGVTAAKLIAKNSKATVTLINDQDRFQERMRNHQVAAGQRVPGVPLSDLVKGAGIQMVIDRATRINTEERQVDLAKTAQPIGYDTLVYALGSRENLDAVPGAAEHATAVATAGHAQQLHDRMSSAATIAVVGGGLTGIETATELAESYPDRTVRLVTGESPGAMLNERGRKHLLQSFDRLGIEVVKGSRVAKVAQDGVLLENGVHVAADAVVWTAGFAVPALAAESGLDVDDRGRMLVDATMRSLSHPDVYGIGDAAAARDVHGEQVRMGCGPGGISAVFGALAITDRLAGHPPKPFRYEDQAWCISLGRHDGIVQYGLSDDGRLFTGRLGAFMKERIIRGSVFGLRHPVIATRAAKRY